MIAPEEVGIAEIRYIGGRHRKVVHRHEILLTKPTASLNAPRTVKSGSTMDVEWTGPANPRDRICVVNADAPSSAYGVRYIHVGKSKTVQINTPKEPGNYEIRYVTRQKHLVLASLPLTVR